MASVQPTDARVKDLVAQFIKIGIAQYDAVYVINNARYTRLYKQMDRIREELRKMLGDQRRALLPLLSYPNVQVRLKAAHSLLALYPDLARDALVSIRESGIAPQNAEAGMAISGLDEVSYVPK